MKTVDKSYSYDELEGFEAVDLAKRRLPSTDIWMSASDSKVRFSSAARSVLFSRPFIRILYNKGTRQLLMISSPDEDRSTIRSSKSAYNGITANGLRTLLERELKYDLSVVTVRIKGAAARTRANAIIFDLASTETRKRNTYNKK